MKHPLPMLLLTSLALSGCGTPPQRAEFVSGYPTYNCPDRLEGQVTLQAEIRPLELAMSLPQPPITTRGRVAKRLFVSVTPAGLRPEDRIIWSTLRVATLGGTLVGWDHFEQLGAKRPTQETSTIVASPGQLKITRIARGRDHLAGTASIDLHIMPGGVAVDDTVVHFAALWTDRGTPLATDHVSPRFIPLRHPPGLDVVEATLELSFVVRQAETGDEWVCSSETRVTLVDRESLALPLWDLGLASENAVRKERVALFDPTLGAVRLVFDDPTQAHSFVSWMRATGASQVGTYALSIVEQPVPRATRPFGPVSEDVMPTLRPVTSADLGGIKVGPAGEP